jgi:enoyl-CoA hydratase/carnithine racemase
MDLNYLKLELIDHIAVVTLQYPPLNLLNINMVVEFKELFEELSLNPDIRCAVVTGSGTKAFCAGDELGGAPAPMPKGMRSVYITTAFNTIEAAPFPVIAAINGYALGGGLEMAMACDIRLAADTAKMGLVEAARGLIASNGGVTRLPWLIGEANAKKMYFTAAKLTAEQALNYGLVQEVIPADKLMDRAMELAREITANAPLSMGAAKAIMHDFRANLFDASFAREQKHQNRVLKSSDFKEGVKAFKEKRQPNWQGK